MDFNRLFVKDVPFPYFIYDQTMSYKASSKQARELFPHLDDFIQLIDLRYQKEAIEFFLSISGKTSIEVPMNEIDKKSLYKIFKANDEFGNIHIYCLPIKTEMAELQAMMNQIEQKLIQYNVELMDKKQFLEESVHILKEAAIEAERRDNIENLAAGIAHEIRNPLTTVKGFIQLLRPYLKEIDKEQYADIALDEIDRANGIIFEFLNAAKPHMAVQNNRTINHLVKDIAMLYESEAILRDIQIVTVLSSEDATLRMDANQLKQVLINIIKNSIEAIDGFSSPANERTIHISTDINWEMAVISIKDNGCGMSPETLNKLFLPFYTTKENGTGIGLSVCKKIVEDSGGTIQVDSTPGTGTLFMISFPSTMFMMSDAGLNSEIDT